MIAAALQVNLGFAPATGRDGMAQCSSFKGIMWGLIGRNCDGAYLKEIHDGEKLSGVAVEYYPDVPGAEEYAMKALELKSRVWDMVEGKAACRIVARSRGA